MLQIIKKSLSIVILAGLLLSPVMAYATTPTTGGTVIKNSTTATTATKKAVVTKTQTALGEVSNFGELISLIWNYGSQIIIALSVFFIILGALFYITSAGNEGKINQGKQMVFGSLIAVVIVIFSGVLMRTLHKTAEGTTGNLTDVPTVINNATNILVGFVAAFSVLMFIYAGINYMLARGDADKINKAHRALRYAVLGLIIGVLAYGIVNSVISYLL